MGKKNVKKKPGKQTQKPKSKKYIFIIPILDFYFQKLHLAGVGSLVAYFIKVLTEGITGQYRN